MTARHPAWAIAVWLSAFACTPRPSTEPLGWGPLAPGMQAEPTRHVASVDRRAHSGAKKANVAGDTSAHPAEAVAAGSAETPKTAPSAEAARGSSDAKAKATTAAFVGDYAGEDVAIYKIESLPDRTEKDPKARLTVTSSSDTALAFELVDSSNGKEICTLDGTLGDSGATIRGGQKCFEQNGEDASASAKVLTGRATVDKTRLLFDLDMSFAMEVAGRKLGGTLAYHFDGTRK